MTIRFSQLFPRIFLLIAISCFTTLTALAADEYNGRVKGTVSTSDGHPIAGATVQVKNTSIAAITDETGSFILKNLMAGNYTVIISYAGVRPTEKEITVLEDKVVTIEFIIQQSSGELEEIVVDGRKSQNVQPVSIGKIPIAPMDIPQSITIIDKSIIRDQQSQRLSDVMKNVNGVYLSSSRGSTQESFFARGYRMSGDNMYKNGARINAGVMPEMSSLEKVEVLKGSAAILYGNVAPGGIVNMVTKKPKFDFGGEVSFRTGSFDLYKPAFDVYGPLSSKVAFRVNGTYENAGSYRDEVSSKRYYINPSLLFKLNKKTSLLVQADYLNHEFTPDFGLGSLNNTLIANLPRSTFQGVAWQYNIARQATATAELKHRINNSWNLNFTTSYQSYDRDYYSLERIQAKDNGDWARPLNKIQSGENYYLARRISQENLKQPE